MTLRTYVPVLCLLLTLCLALPLVAQEGQPSAEEAAMMEAMMKAGTPGDPHADLAEQAGTWKATMTMYSGPDAPPAQSVGSTSREMILGGRVLEETFKMDFMGMPFEGIGHSGYDNVTGKHWGTWFDNMSTGLTHLEGTFDMATGKGLMEGETSDPITGGKIPMRIEIQRHPDGKETNTHYMGTPDGKWNKSMEIVFERQ